VKHPGSNRQRLRDRRFEGRQAGARRLLGDLVRSVPNDRAHRRADPRRAGGQDQGCEDGHRREPVCADAARDHVDPDRDHLQGRKARRADGRLSPEHEGRFEGKARSPDLRRSPPPLASASGPTVFAARDTARLMHDSGIVRNRAKIEATINNARRYPELVEEFGSFAAYVWRYEPKRRSRLADRAALMRLGLAPEAAAMSKDLRRRGWGFVGPMTVYSFMQ